MSLPIGGFMPLPLPMMIPFMAAQSAAMAQAFGTYFQYGKRKISSMSNEEFNKLTTQSMHETLTADIRAIIPSLAESMHTYDSSMTPQIIKEFSEIAKAAISETTTEIVNTVGSGIELGVQTSKAQINDFIAALTTFMATQHNTHYVNPNTTVQQQDITVQDIKLEEKRPEFNPTIEDTPANQSRLQRDYEQKVSGWNQNTLNAELTRFGIENWQKAIVISYINTKSIPQPPNQPLTGQESKQKSYLSTTIKMQQEILIAVGNLNISKNRLAEYQASSNPQGNTLSGKARAVSTAQSKLAAKEKLLINFILMSRNDISLKSVANPDWNNRIWKM